MAQPLGHLLAQAFVTYNIQADMIVPVPLHSERERQRGYNHAYLLAQVCSLELGIPLYTDLLIRQRPTLAQVDLNPSERRQNVDSCWTNTLSHSPGR